MGTELKDAADVSILPEDASYDDLWNKPGGDDTVAAEGGDDTVTESGDDTVATEGGDTTEAAGTQAPTLAEAIRHYGIEDIDGDDDAALEELIARAKKGSATTQPDPEYAWFQQNKDKLMPLLMGQQPQQQIQQQAPRDEWEAPPPPTQEVIDLYTDEETGRFIKGTPREVLESFKAYNDHAAKVRDKLMKNPRAFVAELMQPVLEHYAGQIIGLTQKYANENDGLLMKVITGRYGAPPQEKVAEEKIMLDLVKEANPELNIGNDLQKQHAYVSDVLKAARKLVSLQQQNQPAPTTSVPATSASTTPASTTTGLTEAQQLALARQQALDERNRKASRLPGNASVDLQSLQAEPDDPYEVLWQKTLSRLQTQQ